MWSHNSTTYGLCFNRYCIMCHTSMAQRHDYNNTVLTSFLDSQNAPESVIYGFSHATNPLFHVGNDQEAGAQMATNEADSWLLSINPCYNQIDGPLNLASQEYGQFDHHMQSQGVQVNCNEIYGQFSREGFVEQQEHALNFTQGFKNVYPASTGLFYPRASIQPTGAGAGIIPEETFGMMNRPQEWAVKQVSFSPFNPGNLTEETLGSHSNSTAITSQETQLQSSRDDLQRPFQFPPMSRHERILRYFEKKKSRKYVKKIIHSSRKAYARSRPRVRGRFARISQINA